MHELVLRRTHTLCYTWPPRFQIWPFLSNTTVLTLLTSAHNRKKAEYFWPSVKWFPLKTVFFISSVKYSLYITHHRALRRDTCIFSTKHFTAKRTACCWHNQLSSGKVPMPGGRIISFPSRSRQTSVRQPGSCWKENTPLEIVRQPSLINRAH